MLTSNIVFFPCRDLKETVDFYTRAAGLTVFLEMNGCVILDSGYGYLGFCRYEDDRPMASGICISLNVRNAEEVDEYYRKIKRKKPECLVQPPKRHERFPVYSFFMKDPNGYLTEIQKIEKEG